MQSFHLVCFLLTLCSILDFSKRYLGYFFMDCVEGLKHLSGNADFGFGFLVFGWLGQVYKVLGLFLLFGLGLRVLQFSWYFSGWSRFCGELRNGYDVPYLMNSQNKDKAKCDEELNDDDDNEEECCDEDQVFDVLSLRKLVKIERGRVKSGRLEIEKERMAAATAAEEAMAMILRLQNEKSLVEMEAKQYKRLAEEKQLHDQEVIQSLQWLLFKHESERSILECTQKVKPFGERYEEGDHSDENQGFDDAFHYTLFSSLDMDLSLGTSHWEREL